jgi:hypothetical protein
MPQAVLGRSTGAGAAFIINLICQAVIVIYIVLLYLMCYICATILGGKGCISPVCAIYYHSRRGIYKLTRK